KAKPFVDEAVSFVMGELSKANANGALGGGGLCKEVDIFGFSRGAVFAVMLTSALQSKKVKHIRFLGIIDPVSNEIADVPFLRVSSIVDSSYEAKKKPPTEIFGAQNVPN